MFILGWSLMHDLDPQGPLHDLRDPQTQSDAILVVSISGVDETTGQTMLSRFIYDHHKIRWGHRHVDLLHTDAQGQSHMDYSRIHDTEAEA